MPYTALANSYFFIFMESHQTIKSGHELTLK